MLGVRRREDIRYGSLEWIDASDAVLAIYLENLLCLPDCSIREVMLPAGIVVLARGHRP
jgi:hypothetical protein